MHGATGKTRTQRGPSWAIPSGDTGSSTNPTSTSVFALALTVIRTTSGSSPSSSTGRTAMTPSTGMFFPLPRKRQRRSPCKVRMSTTLRSRISAAAEDISWSTIQRADPSRCSGVPVGSQSHRVTEPTMTTRSRFRLGFRLAPTRVKKNVVRMATDKSSEHLAIGSALGLGFALFRSRRNGSWSPNSVWMRAPGLFSAQCPVARRCRR